MRSVAAVVPCPGRPARIASDDGRHAQRTVTVRGAVLAVTARHTWHSRCAGRIVTVTDAATGGALTIRRAVRIA